jgi:hypothetical protein
MASEQDPHAVPLLHDGLQVRVDSSEAQEHEVVTKIYVEGICCPNEVGVIDGILWRLPGVRQVILFYFV